MSFTASKRVAFPKFPLLSFIRGKGVISPRVSRVRVTLKTALKTADTAEPGAYCSFIPCFGLRGPFDILKDPFLYFP